MPLLHPQPTSRKETAASRPSEMKGVRLEAPVRSPEAGQVRAEGIQLEVLLPLGGVVPDLRQELGDSVAVKGEGSVKESVGGMAAVDSAEHLATDDD